MARILNILYKKNISMRKIYLLDLFDLLSMSEGMFEKKSAPAPNPDEGWTKTVEEIDKGRYVAKTETWTSKDGSSRYSRSVIEHKEDNSKRIEQLEEAMNLAVDREEFEKAAELRDKLKELKK